MKSAPKARFHHQPARSHAISTAKPANAFLVRFGPPFLILLLTFVAFFPTLQNGFVNWDDDANLLDNPHYRGLGWQQIRWMFTTFYMSVYRPLTWIPLGFDYVVWGMNPFGYHLTSLLFHCANAVLFYLIAVRLLALAMPARSPAGLPLSVAAAFATLCFSLHPLLTVLVYLKAVRFSEDGSRRWRWMSVSWFCFALSLLAKGSAVPLPLALLVIDIYPLKRLQLDPRTWFAPQTRDVLLEKIP